MAELKLDCPYCHKPKHLYWNSIKRVWHCFRCGRSGKGIPPTYSCHQLMNRISGKGKPPEHSDYTQSRIRLPPDYKKFTGWTHATNRVMERACWNYLLKRGLRQLEIFRYGIGWGNNRIIFPLRATDTGTLTYWVARRISGSPAYMNPRFPRQGALFWSSRWALTSSAVCLVEGVFDAIKLGRKFRCVSALGKRVTPRDFRNIAFAGVRKVFVVFDPDATEEAREATDVAMSWMEEAEMIPTFDGDPAETWSELGERIISIYREEQP